jgi:dynein heavy chain
VLAAVGAHSVLCAPAGFFFPQGFLTAVLQDHSRKSGVPVDQLGFSHRVITGAASGEDVRSPAAHGVYIHGLLLEAARWGAVYCMWQSAQGVGLYPLG